MTRTFKVFSALLSYPTDELKAAVSAFPAVLAQEGVLNARQAEGVAALIDEIHTRDLLDLQERYVQLFDRSRTLSLHLFEHVHGESRDRGQAMVDLQSLYEQRGLAISATELPDYLPLFLEFLSTLPKDEAFDLLTQPAHVLAALAERLRRRESSYTAILEALSILGGADGMTASTSGEADENPNDLAAIDAAWESEAVSFGPGAAKEGCPKVAGMLERLSQAWPAAPGGRNNG